MPENGEPKANKLPSALLGELRFTHAGVTDTDETPKTFDTVKSKFGDTVIAYDEQHREWILATDNLAGVEAALIAAGFTHAPSPFSPDKDDTVH